VCKTADLFVSGSRLCEETRNGVDAYSCGTVFREVRAHVEKMQKGDCSMMHDMMQGMMGGMGKPGANPQPK
jgi:hypothetical protein